MSCKFELPRTKNRRHRSQSALRSPTRSISPSISVFNYDDDSVLAAECRLLESDVQQTHHLINKQMQLTFELTTQNSQLELRLELYLKRQSQMRKTIERLMREHLQSVGLLNRQIQHRELQQNQRRSQCTQLSDLYSSLQQFKKKILVQENTNRNNFANKTLQILNLKMEREGLLKQLGSSQFNGHHYRQLMPTVQSVSLSSSLTEKVEIQHLVTQAQ